MQDTIRSSTLPAWVESFFDGAYAQCDLIWDEQHSRHAAKFLLEVCAPASPQSITFYDQCCGRGELSVALARHGARGYGVDQSQLYITAARSHAFDESLSHAVHFDAADAGQWSPPSPVDLGVNWHTSLGYGGYAGAHMLLRQLHASVRSRGHYVLDVRNVEHYKQQPTTTQRTLQHPQWGSVILTRSGNWGTQDQGHVLTQHWVLHDQSGKVLWEQKGACCFHPSIEQVRALLMGSDRIVDVFSDVQGRRDLHAPRQLIVVQRHDH